jgi:UDPglucose--hexose-1-phosphate uridylyltransferase
MTDRRGLRKDPLTGRWIAIADWTELDPMLRLDPAELEGGKRAGVVSAHGAIFDRKVRADRAHDQAGLHQTMSAAGEHEVILESAEGQLVDLEIDHLAEILGVYRDRMKLLAGDNRFRQLVLVKRHGVLAGARTTQSHAELYALPFVPDELRQRLQAFSGHQRRGGTCVLCDELQAVRADRARFVEETLRHLCLTPFASARPYEVLLAPKGHHADFRVSSDAELSDLGRLLKGTLQRLRGVLGDPAYRMILYTAPLDAGADVGAFHWHLSIQPVLPLPSALSPVVELNPVPPEIAAAQLREASSG